MSVVVVTGVSSFVGFHLANHFAMRGERVIATLGRPRNQYQGVAARRLASIAPMVELYPLDLRQADAIPRFVDSHAPSLWIHHAGYAENYASPDYDLDRAQAVNVTPLSPLYRALGGGTCGIIITGSSAEYESAESGSREDDPCNPDLPYGLSKLMQTLRARQLAERHGVPTRVARLFIPFGTLDNPQKLVPQAVEKLRSRQPIALSPCEQKRDFIGIGDVCTAYEKLAFDLPRAKFDIFNIASGNGIRLRDFLCNIADRLGASRSLLRFGEIAMRPGEPAVSYADIRKAQRLLGWTPAELDIAIDRDLLTGAGAVDAAGANSLRH